MHIDKADINHKDKKEAVRVGGPSALILGVSPRLTLQIFNIF